MNTTKSVYNRLFQEDKVELASERVELANINDLVNELKKAEKLLDEFNALYSQVDNIQPKIVKVGNELFAAQQKLNSMESVFTKQFAELGLKFADYPEFKNVSLFMSKSRMIKTMTDKIAQL